MVITSALHAEGRQFNSGRNHAFFKTNTLCFFCSMFNREDGNSHFLIDSEISEISTRSASHFIAFVKYSRTPTNGHLSTTVIFLGGQSKHSLLFQTLYKGHLSTIVTFFCPQGGGRKEVQFWKQLRGELESKCVPQLFLGSWEVPVNYWPIFSHAALRELTRPRLFFFSMVTNCNLMALSICQNWPARPFQS